MPDSAERMNQLYIDQFRLLEYLQSIGHPAYEGTILIVGYFVQGVLVGGANPDSVSYISDAGFERNSPDTKPEDMNYIQILNRPVDSVSLSNAHLVEEISAQSNGEVLLFVDAVRVLGVHDVLPIGKPIIRRPRQ